MLLCHKLVCLLDIELDFCDCLNPSSTSRQTHTNIQLNAYRHHTLTHPFSHHQAMSATSEAITRFQSEGVAWLRPPDYYAEVKSLSVCWCSSKQVVLVVDGCGAVCVSDWSTVLACTTTPGQTSELTAVADALQTFFQTFFQTLLSTADGKV